MSDDKKKKQEDADDDARFDHLVPVTGGLIQTEVVEEDESDLIRHRIQEITRRVDENRLELGALFFRVRLNAIYGRWKSPVTGKAYQTWEEYVDTESAFSVRSIQHMVAMWWWFSELTAFPQIRQRINEIGWGKARILVGLADDTNYEAWFDLAKETPQAKLAVSARAAMDKVGIPRRPSIGVARPDPKGVLPPNATAHTPADGVDTKVETKATVSADGVVAELAGDVIVSPVNAAPVNATPTAPLGESERKGVDVPTGADLDAYAEKRIPWKCLMDAAQSKHVDEAVKVTYDVLRDTGVMKDRPASADVGRGMALEMMATHFLSFYSGANAVNKGVRSRIFFGDIARGLEKNFEVDALLIDRKTGEVLHGVQGTGDKVFESLEKRLGVQIVALKAGTHECVYGYDSLTRIVSGSEEESEEPEEGGGEES